MAERMELEVQPMALHQSHSQLGDIYLVQAVAVARVVGITLPIRVAEQVVVVVAAGMFASTQFFWIRVHQLY